MSQAPILDARQITRKIGARVLLAGVDLSIHERDRIGLVGSNGSGKSTLARYLAGVEKPDGGTLALRGDARIGYLDQAPSFDRKATALNVVLGGLGDWSTAYEKYQKATQALTDSSTDSSKALDKALEAQASASEELERLGGWEREHEARALLKRLGVERMEGTIGTMSGGEIRRTALARLLVNPPDLAILDEPTNHLDVETIEWLEEYLRRDFAGALVLITHDRYILDRVATRTAELHDGKLSMYQGGWSTYLEEKLNREAHDARTLANRKNAYRTELDWLRTQPRARTTKSKARIGSAEALGEAIRTTKKARRLSNLEVQATRAGKRTLEIENLRLEIPGRVLIEDFSLALGQKERVGIIGPNGAGKTTLLRALLGEMTPTSGSILPGQNTQFLYVDQRKDLLDEERTVTENVSDGNPTVTVFGREMAIQSWLERFLFFGQDQRAPVKSLSGGERARVALAKTFLNPGNFLLLDEPTNDLDVMTLSALEAMLRDSNVSCFVVTHDRYFLDRVATSILAFEGDGKVVKYEGNYSDYEKLSRERRKGEASQPASVPAPAGNSGGKARKAEKRTKKNDGLTYAERLELSGIEGEVGQLETEKKELETSLSDPSLYSDRAAEAPKLNASLEGINAELSRKMDRWVELESKKASE